MTQKELVITYIKEFGKILPAKISGIIYKGIMFGSETSKRCRELRAKGFLISHDEGKFEVYTLPQSVSPREVKREEVKEQKLFEFEPIKKFRNPYET